MLDFFAKTSPLFLLQHSHFHVHKYSFEPPQSIFCPNRSSILLCDEIRQHSLDGRSREPFAKMDRVQESAARFCNFKLESLSSRREAAAAALACKLLDNKARGDLAHFKPAIKEPTNHPKQRTRSNFETDVQLESSVMPSSLDTFKRSFWAAFLTYGENYLQI